MNTYRVMKMSEVQAASPMDALMQIDAAPRASYVTNYIMVTPTPRRPRVLRERKQPSILRQFLDEGLQQITGKYPKHRRY